MGFVIICTAARRLLVGLVVFAVCCSAKEVRIGALAIRGLATLATQYGPTFETYLNQQPFAIAQNLTFVMVPLDFVTTYTFVADKSIDFIYTNPAIFSCLEEEFPGVRAMASQVNLRGGKSLTAFGGIFLVRSDSGITKIAELKDKIVEAVSISGLGAAQVQWREMLERGMSFMNDPAQIRFSFDQLKIVKDVINGDVHVGMVRTDTIEAMAASGQINMTDLRVLEPKNLYLDNVLFPFQVSTNLVPEWCIAALPGTSDAIAREVTLALLRMQAQDPAAKAARITGWVPPLSYYPLHVIATSLGFSKNGVCLKGDDLYLNIPCPADFTLRTREEVDTDCALKGYSCPDGYACLCKPCNPPSSSTATWIVVLMVLALCVTFSSLIILLLQRKKLQAVEQTNDIIGIQHKRSAKLVREMESLIDKANAPIFQMGLNGNIEQWNLAAVKHTGVSLQYAIGKNLCETFIRDPERRKTTEAVFASCSTGDWHGMLELILNCEIGDVRILVIPTQSFDEDGRVTGVVCIGSNITAFQQEQVMLARAEAATELEKRVTSYLSHELRNAVCMLLGIVELWDPIETDVNVKKDLEITVNHMMDLMNTILDIAKIEAGHMVLQREPIDLNIMIETLARMHHSRCKPGVKFISVCTVKKLFYGDQLRLKQVLANLLSNSLKYTRTGSVELAVKEVKDGLQFSVNDTGPGMLPSDVAVLWDRFTQRGMGFGTSGLGMNISHKLVGLMRALKNEIKVETQLGVGTQMSFVLPADFYDGDDVDFSGNLHNKSGNRGSKHGNSGSDHRIVSGHKHDLARINPNGSSDTFRICMADDHLMNYQILKRKFQVPGKKIEWEYFSNGESLLEKFKNLNCVVEEGEVDCGTDMILLDQNMGGDRMLGTDVCRQLRDKGLRVPIIGLSGNDYGTPFFDAGADFVFVKPMNNAQCQFVCKQIGRLMEGEDLEVLPTRSTTSEALAASNFIFSPVVHVRSLQPSHVNSTVSEKHVISTVSEKNVDIGIDLVTEAMYSK